jgi:molecular chaperone HtpG
LKSTLGDRVHEVRVSQRLVESPAVIVDSDKHLTSGMRRILRAASQGSEPAAATQDLELNPRHLIVQRLETERRKDPELAVQVAEQLLDNARVAAGLLEDPRAMVKRLNDLLQRLLSRPG